MSKKDRVLISILATMMLNTSTFSLFAAADNTTNINNTAESGNVLNETAPSEDAASEIQQDASEQTSESDPQEKNDVTEITEHSWGSWETEKESTITEAGIRIHTCTKCGKVERAATPKQSLRICGSNRFNTAFEAAKQIMKENGGKKYVSLSDYYNITGVPTMILVGKDGKVLDTNARGAKLEKLLQEQFPDVK